VVVKALFVSGFKKRSIKVPQRWRFVTQIGRFICKTRNRVGWLLCRAGKYAEPRRFPLPRVLKNHCAKQACRNGFHQRTPCWWNPFLPAYLS